MFEYVIIGAGPAGLQMGYFLEKAQQDYVILEGGAQINGFFREYPKHRTLLSINKVNTGFKDPEINLRWDWNSLLNDQVFFKNYSERYFPSAEDLCAYLDDFAETHQLNIQLNHPATRISQESLEDGSPSFLIQSEGKSDIRAKRVIVATGVSKEKVPAIPGIELAEMYSQHNLDQEAYKNQRVLIIGKGNSAFETAEHLVEHAASIHLSSPHPVKLAWKTHYVGNLRAVNNNFLDTYQLKSQNVILDAEIDSLSRVGEQIHAKITYTHAKNEEKTIAYDKVIVAAGFGFDDSMFDENCKPELVLDGKLPSMNSSWESSNVPNLYFVGTLMQMRDYKKTMSGFIHGFRHNIQALHQILNEKHHQQPWPVEERFRDCAPLTQKVLDRLTRSASIFLQPGFFGDLIVQEADGQWTYRTSLPLEYLAEHSMANQGTCCTISLEYGDFSKIPDPFNIERDPDPAKAHLVEYLHPIIRTYQNGELVDTFHVLEDLENQYQSELFEGSVGVYFEKVFEGTGVSPKAS